VGTEEERTYHRTTSVAGSSKGELRFSINLWGEEGGKKEMYLYSTESDSIFRCPSSGNSRSLISRKKRVE